MEIFIDTAMMLLAGLALLVFPAGFIGLLIFMDTKADKKDKRK